jgi:hypothetical protein
MKRALWAVNGLLGLGIVTLALTHLLFPAKIHLLEGIDPTAALPSPPPKPGERPNEEVLLILKNPLGARIERIQPPEQTLSLDGALPTVNGEQGVAFIRTAGNVSLVVPIGEEVRGWRLTELWKDRAALTNVRGERTEVEIRRSGQSTP